jgi:hypothetical protein
MEDCKYHDSMGFNEIEDGIRKAARLHATNVSVLDGKAFRVFCSEIDCAIDLRRELRSKTRLPSSYYSAAPSNSARAARRKTTFKVIPSGGRQSMP